MLFNSMFYVVYCSPLSITFIDNKHYSKLYVLSDINFAGVTDEEQKAIIINFSKVLKTIPCRFSFSVANEHVDEKAFHEKVLYRLRNDKYDDLRRSYNRIIKEKIKNLKRERKFNVVIFDDYMDHGNGFNAVRCLLESLGANKIIFVSMGIFRKQFQRKDYIISGNIYGADRILESGGILMSEYPVGTKVDKFRFVNRNRLIVGMSRAVALLLTGHLDPCTDSIHIPIDPVFQSNFLFLLLEKKR